MHVVGFVSLDDVGADGSLSWKTSPARIDSTIAGVPPSSRCYGVVEVHVFLGIDVGDGAAADHNGNAVGEQLPTDRQDARACRGRRRTCAGERKMASL